METRLFKDFPLCGFGDSFTRITLAFGKRYVFVLLPVDEKNSNFAIDSFPADCSSCDDNLRRATHALGTPRFLPIISIMVSF